MEKKTPPSTSLCGGETAREVLRDYHRWWNCQAFEARNPAPQPTSLERDHFPLLLQHDYMVSDKSDGTRFLLFLTHAAGRELAVLVDRKLTLYQVPVAANRSFFAGSLYDGELVSAAGCDVFLVFDAVAHRGERVGHRSLLERLAVIRGAFDLEGAAARSPEEAATLARKGKVVCGGSARGLCFRPKPCFQMRQLDTLLRQIPLLPYAVDGLVLTPVRQPVLTGTHATTFKLKWRHSIDVEVANDGRELLVGLGGAPDTAVQRVPLSGLGLPLRLDEELQQRLPHFAGAILELDITPAATEAPPSPQQQQQQQQQLRLSFKAVRTDKAHPNAVATVLRTAKNVRENITAEELLALAREASEQQLRREG